MTAGARKPLRRVPLTESPAIDPFSPSGRFEALARITISEAVAAAIIHPSKAKAVALFLVAWRTWRRMMHLQNARIAEVAK
jgi:hypothetical protein